MKVGELQDKIKKDREKLESAKSRETDKEKVQKEKIKQENEKQLELINRLIDNQLAGLPVEQEYSMMGGKLSFTLREPPSSQQIICEEMIFAGNTVIGALPSVVNQYLASTYLKKYGDTDYTTKQGDKYNSKEGILERHKFIEGLSSAVRNCIVDKLHDFKELLEQAFSSESLENF